MDRPSWDEYGLALAEVAATRSACSKSRVGAIILDESRRVIGMGYNGLPSGFRECSDGGCPRGWYGQAVAGSDYSTLGSGYCPAAHAEINAVLNASANVRGCTIYVTREPCRQCVAFLAQTCIELVVWGPENALNPHDEVLSNIQKSYAEGAK